MPEFSNLIESATSTLEVQYWNASDGRLDRDPESSLPEVDPRPSIGVCFSGGGMRSATASLGQMRALDRMGFTDQLRYTSGTSGGSWLPVPYTYLRPGISDEGFFGSYLPPEAMGTRTPRAPDRPQVATWRARAHDVQLTLSEPIRRQTP